MEKIGDVDWTKYDSSKYAGRQLQLNQGSISACCNEKRNHTGGYEFKFYLSNEEQCLT